MLQAWSQRQADPHLQEVPQQLAEESDLVPQEMELVCPHIFDLLVYLRVVRVLILILGSGCLNRKLESSASAYLVRGTKKAYNGGVIISTLVIIIKELKLSFTHVI